MEGCGRCSCCTNCQEECGCVGAETEDQTIIRVLGVPLTSAIKEAEEKGKNLSWKRRSTLEVSTVTRTLGRLARRIPAASQRRRRRGEDKLILKEHASYSKTT